MNLYTFSWTPPETRHCASSEPQPSVVHQGLLSRDRGTGIPGPHGWGFVGFRYFSSQIFEEVKFSDGFRGRESSFSQGVTWGENKVYLPYGSVDSPTAAVVRPRKSFDRILQTSWTNFKSGSLWFTCETPTNQLSTYLVSLDRELSTHQGTWCQQRCHELDMMNDGSRFWTFCFSPAFFFKATAMKLGPPLKKGHFHLDASQNAKLLGHKKCTLYQSRFFGVKGSYQQ